MNLGKFSFNSELNDLKKFENLDHTEKQIVFYSENQNSMFIFKSLIEELINQDITICYVTSSKDDPNLKSSNEKIPIVLFADTITFKIGLTIKGTYIEQDANAVFFQVDGEQQIPQVAVSKQLDENKFLFKKSHIELVKIDNGKIIFDANTPKDKEPIIYDPKTGEIIKN